MPLERYASYVFWKEVGIRYLLIPIILRSFMTFTSLNTRMGIPEKIIPNTYEACAQLIVVSNFHFKLWWLNF